MDNINPDNNLHAEKEEEQIKLHCEFIQEFTATYKNYDTSHLSEAAKASLENAYMLMAEYTSKDQIPPKGRQTEFDFKFSGKGQNNTDDSSDSSDLHLSSSDHEATPAESKPSKLGMLTHALERLDMRKVPEIEPFEDDGEETLTEYITRFEKYCQCNIRGDQLFWLGELKTKLSGETLKVLNTISSKKDTYKEAKQKLLDYDSNTAKQRRALKKQEFKELKYEKGESVYLFSMRLEKTFSMAYKDDITTNKKLIDKFVKSAPKSFSRMIEPELLQNKAKKQPTYWGQMKDYAQVYDLTINENKVAEEITAKHTINIGAGADQNTEQESYWASEQKKDSGGYHDRTFSRSYQPRNKERQDQNHNQPGSSQHHYNRGHQGQRGHTSDRGQYNSRGNSNFRGNPGSGGNQNYRGNSHQRGYPPNRGNGYSARGRGAPYQSRGSNQDRPMPMPGRILTCNMCGKVGHMDRDCAEHRQCYACGNYGHIRPNCPQATNEGHKYGQGGNSQGCPNPSNC